MLRLSAQLLRARFGSAIATLVALTFGVVVLMACALITESGLRFTGQTARYAATDAVVALPELTITEPEPLGDDTETVTLDLPERGTVPADLARGIGALPGVAAAVPDRQVDALVVTPTPAAAPVRVLGQGWSSTSLSPYRVVTGRAPKTAGEVAVDDRLTAAGVRPGRPVQFLIGGTVHEYRVTGTVTGPAGPAGAAGSAGSVADRPAAAFFTDAEVERFDPRPGRVEAVGVILRPGADRDAVLAAVTTLAERAGGKVFTGDDRARIEQPGIGQARSLTVSLGAAFGGYALMIVIFVVAGTVGLSVRQRRRDIALLRAIAATPAQVKRMVLGEVGLLALIAAAIGLPAGYAATLWVRNEFVARGFVPDTFRVSGGLLSAAAAAGAIALVAVVSGWIAVRRISRIRPTEALGEAAVEPSGGSRVRLIGGLVMLGLGVVLVGITGATDSNSALQAAVGMLYTFVLAVALLAPWINRASAVLLGPVLELLWRSSGYLAAANLRANARGMVGILTAMVLSIGFGGSVWFLQDNLQRETITQNRDGMRAQLVLGNPTAVPPGVLAEIRAVPGVRAATGLRHTAILAGGAMTGPHSVGAQVVDAAALPQTMDLGVTGGDLADLSGATFAASDLAAGSAGWTVGEPADLWLGDGTPVRLRLVATYRRGIGFSDVTLPRDVVAGHVRNPLDEQVLIRTDGSARTAQALTALAGRHPGSSLVATSTLSGTLEQDLAISSWANKLLIGVLVGYAALASANTLVMAALARTRELALLRLVGVTRRQVKRMVHAEQAGLLGVALVIGGAIAALTLSTIVHAISRQPIPYVPVTGWVAVIGGTVALATVATVLPIGRVLRTDPVTGIGIKE